MIITVSGQLGTETRIISKLVGAKLSMPHHSTGRLVRSMAEKEDMSLDKFIQMAETNPNIDNEIDMMTAEHGRTKDNFILDSRLGFHFISHSVKILLIADEQTRIRRNYLYDVRAQHEVTMESTAKRIKKMDLSDQKRFKEKYDIDSNDPKHYDLVLDVTNLDLEESADKIVEYVKNN